MVLKVYRLWAMGQLDSTCSAPSLASAWFPVISSQVISWFQCLPLTFNVRRYSAAAVQRGPLRRGGVLLRVQGHGRVRHREARVADHAAAPLAAARVHGGGLL
jgi:hypothetical protein